MLDSFLRWNDRQDQAFAECYRIISVEIESPNQKKIYLGQNQPRLCRYCDEGPEHTTFKEKSHAIPMFLGNRTIIDLMECDRCNHHFGSHFEDSFANYIHPFRPLQRTRGRKGIPGYKDEDLRIQALTPSFLEISAHGKLDFDDLKVEGERRLKLPMKRLPFYPTAVHKSLIKIALALMPAEDHVRFGDLKRWLLAKDHRPRVRGFGPVMEWFISGPTNPDRIRCIVARAKEEFRDKVFEYQLIFCFGNFQFQLTIPLSAEAGKEKNYVRAPLLMPTEHFRAFGESDFEDKIFESGVRVENEEISVLIQYSNDV